MFKVGITINPKKRITEIQRCIKLNLNNSWIIPCLRINEASTIENQIKEQYKEYKVKNITKFDGYTEFYNIEIFSEIFYSIYCKSVEKIFLQINKLENLPPKLFNDLNEETKKIFFENLSEKLKGIP